MRHLRHRPAGRAADRHRVHHKRPALWRVPEEEKRYWHSHQFEVKSGQMSAPGIPQPVEHELMKKLVNPTARLGIPGTTTATRTCP